MQLFEQYPNQVLVTASGSWTAPTTISEAIFIVAGGGGGGGGGSDAVNGNAGPATSSGTAGGAGGTTSIVGTYVSISKSGGAGGGAGVNSSSLLYGFPGLRGASSGVYGPGSNLSFCSKGEPGFPMDYHSIDTTAKNYFNGGNGGDGGDAYGTAQLMQIAPGGIYTITVGAGGTRGGCSVAGVTGGFGGGTGGKGADGFVLIMYAENGA